MVATTRFKCRTCKKVHKPSSSDLNQALLFDFDELPQVIDVFAMSCLGFYIANVPIYIHYRGLRSAVLGVVMQNDIDRLAGIVVLFPVLWKTKSEGAAAYVFVC